MILNIDAEVLAQPINLSFKYILGYDAYNHGRSIDSSLDFPISLVDSVKGFYKCLSTSNFDGEFDSLISDGINSISNLYICLS